MKIIIVGASGTIGSYVTRALEKQHEVITAGSKSGHVRLDITSPSSIANMFKETGTFDALISITGTGHLGPMWAMRDEDFRKGLDNKLMGQINLVLQGQHYVNPKGSFTLTSGILTYEPALQCANITAVNGAIEAFVRAAAIELDNDVRVNAVSPGIVEDSPGFFPFFPGVQPVPMHKVTLGYVKSVLGASTGKVISVH